jgi:hypothetical protein
MKPTRKALFALLLLGSTAGAASAATSISAGINVGSYGRGASVDVGFFYDNLAPYGNWIQRPRHGWVWTPRSVSSNWRPYQDGHWVNSDQGWTWITDEPYGWATYHYGRWYEDPEIGWAWVPGTDWGPAWVSWQEGNDYVGWAPLPPGAAINASSRGGYDDGYGDDNGYDNGGYDNGGYDNGGYDNGYDNGYNGYDDGYDGYASGYGDGGYGYGGGYGGGYSYGLSPAAYVFVPTRYFLSTSLFSYFVPRVQIVSFFGRTRNCTNYGYSGGRYYNHGISFGHVQRYYSRVPRYRLSELDGFRGHGYRVDGDRVAFYRPRVERGRGGSPLDRPYARRSVVDANRFRAEHPDRQRNYAQNYGRNDGRIGRNTGRDTGRIDTGRINGRDYGRDNRLSYPSRDNRNGQRQGQVQPDRQQRQYQAPRVQGDRQRSYDNQRGYGQPNRQPNYSQPDRQQRQYQAPRVQGDRQRSYDSQRGYRQPEYRQPNYRQQQQQQQRQYQAPRVQQRQPERQRSYEAPRAQQQRQAPQREYRRGQDNRGQDNNRSRDNSRGNDNGRRRGHGGDK